MDFDFGDDLFAETERTRAAKRIGPFSPLIARPQWYLNSKNVPGYEQSQLDAFKAEHLYSLGEFEECKTLILSVLESAAKHNVLERELLETLARCAVHLDDASSALFAVSCLDEHHLVEEVGLNDLKSRVYFHFGLAEKGVAESEEYLRLRPGDIYMHLRVIKNCGSEHVRQKHLEAAKACIWSLRRSSPLLAEQLLSQLPP